MRVEQDKNNTVINKFSSNKPARIISLVLVAGFIFSAGWLSGNGRISFGLNGKISTSQISGSSDISTEGLDEIYHLLQKNYDGTIDKAKLESGIKKGFVSAVNDTYTEYFTPEEAKQFNATLDGKFEGIGAELNREGGYVMIVAPIKGAPAEKAGLLSKDIITEIDGEDATNISVSEAVDRIRGEKGTTVKLKIVRNGEELDFSIVRDTIDIPSVEWRIEKSIGIMEIGRFSSDTTELTRKAAKEFNEKGIKKVILDLRGDPGGLLDQAVGVSSVWLDKGSTVLEEKQGGETVRRFTTSDNPLLKGVETIVLINGGSASASEIVAGALKDNGVATLMGEQSYGKGSVQQFIDLKNGGALKVTIARWYTPGGKNIDKEGIKPDTVVKMTSDDVKAKEDPQLDAALK